ncbi:hypothetical protein GCM10023149_08850 [Mucilaginibacter gynuensis]|uniref:YdhG-like domain-containing protein n=1 Tax=Mucilaginibacter gynuensis TaxID=1302236 RepID=A0ABP8FXU3_9SPHI
MINAADNFYLQKDEPIKGCLLALREIVLKQDPLITTAWKYGMPFFCYRGKMFCYLWVHKKHGQPYIGIVEGTRLEHPELIIEKRSRMKIMLFDAEQDLPITTIEAILQEALDLYRNGVIFIK